LRSARAARLPLGSVVLPEPLAPAVLPEVEGLAPIVPLLLLGVLDVLGLVDGVVAEPAEPVVAEPEVDGEAAEPEVDGVELEPLAPIDVPLPLLGVLAEELEVSLEPLALGVLLEPLALGVLLVLGLLEPEAPIVPVDGWVPLGEVGEAAPAAAPVPPALLVPLAEEPPLEVPLPPLAAELWARA
jgi:hypothetical protein